MIASRRLAERLGLQSSDWAMMATTVIWGLNFIFVKQALIEMLPMVFVSIRFALAAIFVIAILYARGENLRFDRRDAWKFLILGFVGNAMHQTFFTQGIARTTASMSSLISASTPIFIALFSAILQIEQITPPIWVGIGISFGGIAMIVGFGKGELSFADRALLGNLLTLGASLCWAFYTLASRRLMRRYSPLKITALTMTVGSPFLLLFSIGQLAVQDWSNISWRGWLGVGYAFFFASVVSYVIWNISLQKCGNTRTSIYANFVPIVAVIASWLVLGDRLSSWQIVGAIIALGGVTLTRIAPRPAKECA